MGLKIHEYFLIGSMVTREVMVFPEDNQVAVMTEKVVNLFYQKLYKFNFFDHGDGESDNDSWANINEGWEFGKYQKSIIWKYMCTNISRFNGNE